MLRKGPTSLLEVGSFVYSLRMDHVVHSYFFEFSHRLDHLGNCQNIHFVP